MKGILCLTFTEWISQEETHGVRNQLYASVWYMDNGVSISNVTRGFKAWFKGINMDFFYFLIIIYLFLTTSLLL